MKCAVCANEIPDGARKCTQCGEFQSAGARLLASLDLKGLLALLPLLTLIYAFLADRIEIARSDLQLAPLACASDAVSVFASNRGNRSAVLTGAEFSPPGRDRSALTLPPEADLAVFDAGEARRLDLKVDMLRDPGGLVPFGAGGAPDCVVALTFHVIDFDLGRSEEVLVRLSSRLIAGCALAAALAASASAQPARTTVHLFQYGGANSDATREAFANFRDLMVEKLPRLAAELQSEQAVAAAAALRLEPVLSADGQALARPEDRIADLDARRVYWSETGALTLLTGRVTAAPDAGLGIRSTFYLGQLRGPGAQETLDLELPFSANVYDTTNDSHSVALLYLLAEQAGQDCAARADAFFLLNQAQQRAEAVGTDQPALGAELLRLVNAAATELRTRCAGA